MLRSVAAGGIAALLFAMSAPASEAPPSAERITVEFKGGDFALVSRNVIQKRLPPSDEIPEGVVTGFWFELRSADGAVRYRRIIGDPIRLVFEGPAEGSGATAPDRAEGIPEKRVFSVLVPAIAEGDVLLFFGLPIDPPESSAARRSSGQAQYSTELGRISFAPVVR
jgi:hypothetical protein